MADLVSLAQRLNDVEINNNAPVSSQTFRRVGSSINLLLDFLGIANGTTSGAIAPGINIFTPSIAVSYSYTFTAADLNVPKTLFTFTGAGDRPIKYFTKSGDFEASPDQIFAGSFGLQIRNHPIRYLIDQLSTQVGTGANGTTIYSVKVNGIECARTTRQSGVAVVTYTKEITFAPAQVNTVTATLLQAPQGASTPVSSSFRYLAY